MFCWFRPPPPPPPVDSSPTVPPTPGRNSQMMPSLAPGGDSAWGGGSGGSCPRGHLHGHPCRRGTGVVANLTCWSVKIQRQAKTGQSVTSTRGAMLKRGSPSPQLKGPHQSVGVHGEDEKKKCEKGWKWVKIQKCHISHVEEASKSMLGATMMPLVSQSMGLEYG